MPSPTDRSGRGSPSPLRDVEDVRIRRRDRDPADRSGRLVVEDRLPRAAGIGGLPDAAVAHADVEGVRLARVAGGRLRPPGAERTDVAPSQFAEEAGADLRRLLRRDRHGHHGGGKADRRQKGDNGALKSHDSEILLDGGSRRRPPSHDAKREYPPDENQARRHAQHHRDRRAG